MIYLLLTLLILPPLTYYGVDPQWTLTFLQAGSGLLFVGFVFQTLRRKETFYSIPGLLPLACFCCLLLLQLIPLPPVLLKFFSRAAFDHYQHSIWLLEPGAWQSLTVFPKATLTQFFRFSSYALVFVATVQLLNTSDRLKKIALVLSCFGGLYAFISLLQFFSPTQQILWFMAPWPERVSHAFGSYVNGNHYAGLMEMLFPLTITSFLLLAPKTSYGNWRDRLSEFVIDPAASKHILVGFSAVFIALSVLFSLSRGGTISLIVSALVLLALLSYKLKNRRKSIVSLLLLVSLLGLVSLIGLQPVMQRFDRTFNQLGELTDQRPIYWQDSLALIADYPVFGSGSGSFVDSYRKYQSIDTGDLVVRHAHNDYVELLTDTGLVGFLLVVWFLLSLLRCTWSAWKRRRNSTSRYLYLGTLCGIVAILCHSVTDFNLAIPPNGLFFFFLCGLLVATATVGSRQSSKKRELTKNSFGKMLFLSSLGLLIVMTNTVFNAGILLARANYVPFSELAPEQLNDVQRLEKLNDIETAKKWDPFESHYRYAEGIFLRSMIKKTAALDAFQAAIHRRPLRGLYLQQAGMQAASLGKEKMAEQLFTAGLQVQPIKFLPYYEYGLWLLDQRRPDEAFTILKQGLAIHPENADTVLTLLALHWIKPTHMGQALPKRAKSWQLYADYLLALKEEGAADAAYRQAIELSVKEVPPVESVFWPFYRYLQKRKRYSEALALMLQGIKTFPRNGGFHRNAGSLYERQGIVYRAIEEYQQALLLEPKHEWVKKRLKTLQGK